VTPTTQPGLRRDHPTHHGKEHRHGHHRLGQVTPTTQPGQRRDHPTHHGRSTAMGTSGWGK
jgi:hypothetical protein